MNIILKKIQNLLQQVENKDKSAIYDTVVDYLELLTGMIDIEKSRILM